jgi:hypothetical protein
MIWIIYILSVAYCLYKLAKRHQKNDLGGGIGTSPGLDTLMVVLLAPILAVIDVSLTWIRIYKEAEEARRRNTNTRV